MATDWYGQGVDKIFVSAKDMRMKFSQVVLMVWALWIPQFGWADQLVLRWKLGPGDAPFLATDNAHRGAALNPVSGNVLVVSRTGQPDIHVLDGQDGSILYTLDNDPSTIAGGTFLMNMVGVAEDGAVYAGNLSTSAANPNYRLYRWADDGFNAYPDLAYEGDPGLSEPDADNAQRWGDSMDVRGAGKDTQILLASRSGTQVAILTTEDGETFESNPITIAGMPAGGIGLGVSFGPGDTLYGSTVNGPVYLVSFNTQAGTGEVTAIYSAAILAGGIAPLGVDLERASMGALNVQAHEVLLLDLTDAPNPPILQASEAMGTTQSNGNGTGAIDMADHQLLALDTNNGLALWDILVSQEILAPTLITEPTSQAVLETASISFSVAVTGTPPLNYQWFKDDQPLGDATQATLTFDSASQDDAGRYRVEVSNQAGQVSSQEIVFEVHPILGSSRISQLWSLEPGSRTYLTTDNTQRGMAYNPGTGHVLIASRSRGNHLVVLDGETGQTLHEMDTDPTILTAGLFKLNMIAASEDGAIFAGNLTLNGSDISQPYTLYAWPDESQDAVPEIAYQGDPADGIAERWGDSMDARGRGSDRQVLIGSRSGSRVVLFTTEDGIHFEPRLFEGTTGGLGLAFGDGDTFWTKAPAGPLTQYAFDLNQGSVEIIQQFDLPGSVVPIGVSAELGLLAGIDISTPDHLKIYDLAKAGPAWPPMMEVLFATDNANGNMVGAVSFGPQSIYALNTNNGLMALAWHPNAPVEAATLVAIAVQESALTIQFKGSGDADYVLEQTSDFRAWEVVGTHTTNAEGMGSAKVDLSDVARQPQVGFYRLVAY